MFSHLKDDLKSSIVVFLVALPLCLGIALASNAPLASGLIAGIVGGIVVGFLSNSHISVSGPAAGLTVIVAAGIASLGSFQTLALAVLISGFIQIALGVLKAGQIGDYFPSATIKGMLSAIGLILIIKQIPNVIGTSYVNFSFENMDRGVMILSFISLAIMIGWDHLAGRGIKFFKTIPGALFAVVAGMILNQNFHFVSSDRLVSIPGNLFGQLTSFDLSLVNFSLIQIALTLAIVASLETLLCIDAADRLDPMLRKTNKNRELLAQGIGNVISGFLGGLPITAVIVRTSANVNSGARTKMSAIFHGAWLLVCVLLFPKYLSLIPLATLACILLLVGYKLTKPVFYFEMYKKGYSQLLIFCSTIISILVTDLLKGIFIGLVVALAFEFNKLRLSVFSVEKEESSLTIKFHSGASFFHRPQLLKVLQDLGEKIKTVRFENVERFEMNVDVKDFLKEAKNELEAQGKKVVQL